MPKSWLERVAILKVKSLDVRMVCKIENHLQVKGAGRKGLRLELRGRAGVHG